MIGIFFGLKALAVIAIFFDQINHREMVILSRQAYLVSSLKDLRREMMRIMMTKTKGKAAKIAPVWRPLSPPDQRRMPADRD